MSETVLDPISWRAATCIIELTGVMCRDGCRCKVAHSLFGTNAALHGSQILGINRAPSKLSTESPQSSPAQPYSCIQEEEVLVLAQTTHTFQGNGLVSRVRVIWIGRGGGAGAT